LETPEKRKGCALDLPLRVLFILKLHALRKGVRAAFLSAFDLVCVYVRSAAAAVKSIKSF